MKEICKDLADEGQSLDDIVADISDEDWDKVTPFSGWNREGRNRPHRLL
jgi:hypothetical protein